MKAVILSTVTLVALSLNTISMAHPQFTLTAHHGIIHTDDSTNNNNTDNQSTSSDESDNNASNDNNGDQTYMPTPDESSEDSDE